jgi:hypothetical protein
LGITKITDISSMVGDGASYGGTSFVDRIDLLTIDAKEGVGGNQAFKFIGQAAVTAEGQRGPCNRESTPSSASTPREPVAPRCTSRWPASSQPIWRNTISFSVGNRFSRA